MRTIGNRWFLGPQMAGFRIKTTPFAAFPNFRIDATNVWLGVHLQRDSRDSVFYPRTGELFDFTPRFFDGSWGSDFDYQAFPVAYNRYVSLSSRSVLAFRAYGRFTFGSVPFYADSMLGQGADLRGYRIGVNHDREMVALQAEFRQEIAKRWGAVAFVGVGWLAPKVAELVDSKTYTSIGFGLRFKLVEEDHLNYRVDLAYGDELTFYLGVGEAF